MAAKSLRVLVLYLSRTGTGARVARDAARLLERRGDSVVLCPITPSFELPYLIWLLLSFIPGLPTPIRNLKQAPQEFDRCLVIIPKWTFNCPPVEALLKGYGDKLPETFLLVTCGGWDEERYTERYRARFVGAGTKVAGAAALRGERVGKPHFSRMLEIELAKLLKGD